MKELNKNKDLTKLHKEKLGMDIPEDFFSKSKADILEAIPKIEDKKQTVFWLKPIIAYPIAASIVLLIGIIMWMQNDTTKINPKITNVETINSFDIDSDDFLLSSLLIDDDKMDAFMDDFIVNEILVEAELSEQQLDNLFINSLFVEDSLINGYIDKNLIENIVL